MTIEGRITAQLAHKVKCKAQVALATEKGGQEGKKIHTLAEVSPLTYPLLMLIVVLPSSNFYLSRLYWCHFQKGFRITLLNEPASGSDRHSQIYDHRIIYIATCVFTLPHSHLRLIVAALGSSSSLSSHCHAYGPPAFHQVDLKTTSFTYR